MFCFCRAQLDDYCRLQFACVVVLLDFPVHSNHMLCWTIGQFNKPKSYQFSESQTRVKPFSEISFQILICTHAKRLLNREFKEDSRRRRRHKAGKIIKLITHVQLKAQLSKLNNWTTFLCRPRAFEWDYNCLFSASSSKRGTQFNKFKKETLGSNPL